MAEFFIELSMVMFLTFVVSLIINKIKQPLLIGYIISGILASPLFFNILSSNQDYETFAHIGISLLLFIVGLHLNLKLIKEVGFISLVTGLGQVIFTSLIGFLIAKLMGFGIVAAIIIAIALTFSSTIIIVKLLSDKKDLDTLYGKISMGFLIVQDLVAVIILMFISAFLNPNSNMGIYEILIKTLGLGLFSIIITYLLSRYLLPKILENISKSSELLFIFVISWCFLVSSIFKLSGFSLEVGALLAGIALASSRYQYEISSKIKPLRDFFIVMFFILLGSQMIPPVENIESLNFSEKINILSNVFTPILIEAIIFSIFVLVGNPLIVLVLMTRLGYKAKTGFLAGLTVAQISEFSLILAMLGFNAGFLTQNEVSLITLVGIITITASTYLILNGNEIYNKFEKHLKKFDKKNKKEEKVKFEKDFNIFIFGYDRIGFSLLKSINNMKKKYIIIEHNPETIKSLEKKQINCIYGDASDIEFVSEFKLEKAELFISTIPNFEINSLLLKEIRKKNIKSTIILTSDDIDSALELYKDGADYVILPHFLGGNYVSSLIENFEDNYTNFLKEKVKHITELKERKEMQHEHPKKH